MHAFDSPAPRVEKRQGVTTKPTSKRTVQAGKARPALVRRSEVAVRGRRAGRQMSARLQRKQQGPIQPED